MAQKPAPLQSQSAFDYVTQIGQHDHACFIYESPSEVLGAAGAFLGKGYDEGAKCLYITNDHSTSQCRDAFRKAGIPVEQAESEGRLAVLNKHQAYLRQPGFDPDEMVNFLENAVRAENGKPVRGAGEMSWALSSELYMSKLILYESKVNQVFARQPFGAVCFYDRRLFPARVLNEIIRVHPFVLYGQRALRNPFFVPPAEYLTGGKDAAILDRTLRDLLVHNAINPDIREDPQERQLKVRDLQPAA